MSDPIANADTTTGDGAAIDKLLAALTAGDIEAARACCTETLWSGTTSPNPAEYRGSCSGLGTILCRLSRTSLRRCPPGRNPQWICTAASMVGTTASGVRRAWPVCVIVRLRDGLISRFDEYIDRSGSYQVTDGSLVTRGLHGESSV